MPVVVSRGVRLDAAPLGMVRKPQDRSVSANRALQIVPKRTLALSPCKLQAVIKTPLKVGPHLQAGCAAFRPAPYCRAGKWWGGGVGGECSVEARIAEEAEASSPAQEAILEQALNARFQAEFN